MGIEPYPTPEDRLRALADGQTSVLESLAEMQVGPGSAPGSTRRPTCGPAGRPILGVFGATAPLVRSALVLSAASKLAVARTYLALTDAAAARTILWEVDDLLSRRPRLGLLRDLAAELRAQLDTTRIHAVGRRR